MAVIGAVDARIEINGIPLTRGEAHTFRAALVHFMIDMQNSGILGDDETGETLRQSYLTFGNQILELIHGKHD